MNLSKPKVFTIFGAVFLFSLYTYTKFLFWEPSEIKRGSLIYQLKIPKFVKSYPIWSALQAPTYKIRIADGEKPGMVGFHYASSLSVFDTHSHIKQLQFACPVVEKNRLFCTKNDEQGTIQQINVEQSQIGSNIELTFISK